MSSQRINFACLFKAMIVQSYQNVKSEQHKNPIGHTKLSTALKYAESEV